MKTSEYNAAVIATIYNSANTRQKCRVAERRELLRDNRRREKGATRNIENIYLREKGERAPSGKERKT
jgi:hypothetical protein